MKNFDTDKNWENLCVFYWIELIYVLISCIKMNFVHTQTGYNDRNMFHLGPGVLNQRYSVPIQNAFGPLGEWVGMSMDINGELRNPEDMDIQTAQSNRRRFNTGMENTSFSSLSIDDKLTHMCDKLNFLEQANRTVVNIAHGVN